MQTRRSATTGYAPAPQTLISPLSLPPLPVLWVVRVSCPRARRQLNDVWPGQSWSSLDAGAHWKALHYAARRFMEPLHVSAYEEGTLLPALHVHLANDDPWRAWAGTITVELWAWDGGKVAPTYSLIPAYARPLPALIVSQGCPCTAPQGTCSLGPASCPA